MPALIRHTLTVEYIVTDDELISDYNLAPGQWDDAGQIDFENNDARDIIALGDVDWTYEVEVL